MLEALKLIADADAKGQPVKVCPVDDLKSLDEITKDANFTAGCRVVIETNQDVNFAWVIPPACTSVPLDDFKAKGEAVSDDRRLADDDNAKSETVYKIHGRLFVAPFTPEPVSTLPNAPTTVAQVAAILRANGLCK